MYTHTRTDATMQHVHNAHVPTVLVNVRGERAERLEPVVVMALVVTVHAWTVRMGMFARTYVCICLSICVNSTLYFRVCGVSICLWVYVYRGRSLQLYLRPGTIVPMGVAIRDGYQEQ